MTLAAAKEAYDKNYKPICNAFDDSQTGMVRAECFVFSLTEIFQAFVVWVFYASKALDFFDTLWIILFKNWKQLSFLHVRLLPLIFFLS